MQTLRIGRAVYRLSPTRNVGELQAKFAKCTGKHKPTAIKAERRTYPDFKAGMSTARYVELFWIGNNLGNARSFFAPMNENPCTLYAGEDTHETVAPETADDLL